VTVIVVSFFESVVRDHSKDHAVAVVHYDDTLTESHTPLCRTSLKALAKELLERQVSLAGLDAGHRRRVPCTRP
jgi:hypothetical protein